MAKSRSLQQAVRLALASATAAAGVSALQAQEAPAPVAAAAPVEEVVVTGSRLSTPQEASISPITTVSSTDLQATGLTRVEDVLNNLPMVFAGMNSTTSNGGDGTATVDLRGLGPQRTLVLVNGRRLGPGIGDGRNYADLNQIPAALIDRIDIETGGASAVYGADAVAGVVNFVLNTHFEGVKIDAGYNFYEHNNNNSYVQGLVNAADEPLPDSRVDTGFGKNVSIIIGSNFADNKGNATFYSTFDTLASVLQSKYDYSACTLKPNATNSGLECGGSVISKGGYFSAYGKGGTSLFINTVDQKTGQFRPFTAADEYNYGPLNFYQTPQTRWTGGSFVNYDINSHVNVYGELMATRTTVETQVAPGGYFGETGSHFVPCQNPLLNASEAAAICSPANQLAQGNPTETIPNAGGGTTTLTGLNVYTYRRNVEGGGRQQSFANDAIRALVGVKGDFADAWTYDVYAQHSTVDGTSVQNNYLSNILIPNSINVITGPALLPSGAPNPLAGKPECTVTYTGADAKCVPWNIWAPGGVTPAALAYLSVPLLINTTTTEYVADGSVVGDLGKYGLKLPTADSGLQVSIGSEYRQESSAFSPDYEEQIGAAAGAGGPTPPVSGTFHVGEVFTEMRLPLADHIAFADRLDVEGGYRYSAYNLGFNTNTYKFGVNWSPVQDLIMRGSYQRAVRAPNISELYSPQSIGLDFTADPCAGPAVGGKVNGFTAAQCALTGVTGTQFGHIQPNPSAQYNGLLGGNPTLKPEISDTESIGLTIKPRILPNFSASADYYDIRIVGDINSIGGGVILQQCLTTANPLYCDAIHRNATGSLWNSESGYVSDTTVNVGSTRTKGVDVKANYRVPMQRLGSLGFALEGTRVIEFLTQPLTGGPDYDCTGYEGQTCGAGQPKWRSVLNTTWSTPWTGMDITLRWRYIGAVASDTTSPNPILNKQLPVPPGSQIAAYNYIDLETSFAITKIVRLQVGVNNIADKNPPLITGSDCAAVSGTPGVACNGNTWPGTYDSLGRYLFAHVTAQF
jgi:outer membrane receptor protein involved in Fe transport